MAVFFTGKSSVSDGAFRFNIIAHLPVCRLNACTNATVEFLLVTAGILFSGNRARTIKCAASDGDLISLSAKQPEFKTIPLNRDISPMR